MNEKVKKHLTDAIRALNDARDYIEPMADTIKYDLGNAAVDSMEAVEEIEKATLLLSKIEDEDGDGRLMSVENASENVNSPPHYTQGKVECIDALAAATAHLKGIEAVCVGNVIKYVWRYKDKNGIEDLQKAMWYLDRLIQHEKGEGND